MRYYLIAIKKEKTLFDKLLNRTFVEGLDVADCVLFSRLNFHPGTKEQIMPLWSNIDEELIKSIITRMNKYIWNYQEEHKGKVPPLRNIKRELSETLKNQGYKIKENATYYEIKTELTDN